MASAKYGVKLAEDPIFVTWVCGLQRRSGWLGGVLRGSLLSLFLVWVDGNIK